MITNFEESVADWPQTLWPALVFHGSPAIESLLVAAAIVVNYFVLALCESYTRRKVARI